MNSKLNRRLLLAGVLAFPFSASATAKADPKAEAYVSSIITEVISLANSGRRGKALKGDFSRLLNRYVNIRAIANYALGKYQKQLPAKERDMFYGLVSNYAASLFVFYVEDFQGTGPEIRDTAKQGNFVTVNSAILRKSGGRESVRWRLSPGDSGYRVSDVNIKGIWMTISMRKRFNDVLNKSKGDFGPLYAELREAETW
jgi:phospholipid transport system substrate-binding protein